MKEWEEKGWKAFCAVNSIKISKILASNQGDNESCRKYRQANNFIGTNE